MYAKERGGGGGGGGGDTVSRLALSLTDFTEVAATSVAAMLQQSAAATRGRGGWD